jgi:hypothetical protein
MTDTICKKLKRYWFKRTRQDSDVNYTSQWKTADDFLCSLISGTIKIKNFISRVMTQDERILRIRFEHNVEKSKYFIEIEDRVRIKRTVHITYHLDNYNIRWRDVDRDTLHIYVEWFLDHLDEFIKEYNELTLRLIAKEQEKERQKKIYAIAANSIEVWLNIICKDISAPYCIEKDKNKIILSVQLNHRTQLDIPIYYSSFRKIIPEIPSAIQFYKKMLGEAPLKALISNCLTKAPWKSN